MKPHFALRIAAATALAGLSFLLAPSAALSMGFLGWGPRMGLTGDPDQVHMGVHFDFGEVADNVRFQPNLEVGIGEQVTVVTMNYEAAYRFEPARASWSPYLGGGLGVNHRSWDRAGDRPFDEWSDTDLGMNFLMGIEKGTRSGNRFFTELKLGLVEPPDFKFTVGWTFY